MPRWELRGIGYLDPRLVGDAVITDEKDGITSLVGAWEQGDLIELIGALIASKFEVDSLQRLPDARLLSGLDRLRRTH